MPKASSIDVARAAGVSQSTVSRAFSPDSRISQGTRDRVLAAARQLDYEPNILARSLITQRTGIIGIVMTGISSPFYPYVLERFTQRLQQNGQQALLFSAPPGEDIDAILPLALQYRVDGLIITSATLSSQSIEACIRSGTPVVLFNRTIEGVRVNSVSCDNEAGGRLAADLFVQAGHRNPAYITGLRNTSTNIERQRGYLGRLAELGFTAPTIAEGHYTYESGFSAAVDLLSRSDPPDAIFCANDILAMGALDAARHKLGLDVPTDVSIIGFDDIPAAGWSSYGLTTIRQQIEPMIEESLRLLSAEPGLPPVVRYVPGVLVVRDSARVKHG